MPEPLRGKPLQKGIIGLARTLGWRVAHFPMVQDVRGTWRTPIAADGKGFPDLLLVRDRILIREIKGDGDTMKPEQSRWLSAFRLAGADVGVWRPKDWREGRVDQELRKQTRILSPDTECVCMVYDANANAIEAFDYTPEALEAEARRLREQATTT